MEIVAFIAIILFAVLNLILFFKVWGMTNDVSRIADYVQRIANRTISDSKPKTPIGQEATTSTANPMPIKEEATTSTEDPNKDSEVSPAQWFFIAFVVIIVVALFLFMSAI